jgi:DNA-directed RNA polymerase specialized sigma24 family protein
MEAGTDAGRNAGHDLLERFREGDREAFAELYRINHPSVFRFALNMTGDRVKAADITQDVFVCSFITPAISMRRAGRCRPS